MTRSVYIALGSNLPSSSGDRLATLAAAVERLAAVPGVAVAALSWAYETDPIPPGQPTYLNAAAELTTSLAPQALLEAAQSVERSLGRNRMQETRWGPRTIDIDLLLDGESLIESPGLTVPHPRLSERAFVLVPLAEIAALVHDPRTGISVRSLLERLHANDPAAGNAVRRYSRIRF